MVGFEGGDELWWVLWSRYMVMVTVGFVVVGCEKKIVAMVGSESFCTQRYKNVSIGSA